MGKTKEKSIEELTVRDLIGKNITGVWSLNRPQYLDGKEFTIKDKLFHLDILGMLRRAEYKFVGTFNDTTLGPYPLTGIIGGGFLRFRQHEDMPYSSPNNYTDYGGRIERIKSGLYVVRRGTLVLHKEYGSGKDTVGTIQSGTFKLELIL